MTTTNSTTNGWQYVTTKGEGTTEWARYWTKDILGHKVWKKETTSGGHSYHGYKPYYHVEGAKTENGHPVQHNTIKELKGFIEGGCKLSKVIWSDEANDGDGDHITVLYSALAR